MYPPFNQFAINSSPDTSGCLSQQYICVLEPSLLDSNHVKNCCFLEDNLGEHWCLFMAWNG